MIITLMTPKQSVLNAAKQVEASLGNVYDARCQRIDTKANHDLLTIEMTLLDLLGRLHELAVRVDTH